MKKMYHLGNCTTCQAIIKDTGIDKKSFQMQDIKPDSIAEKELDDLKQLAGSYESLFSRRAMKYKQLNLKDRRLSETDYRNFILQEYTFLKRPVTVIGKKIFIGNDKKTIQSLKEEISKL
ncbi:MAG: arsenate reductase [Chitinophagaceae bacterium]|nr:arsenate reductase [Chitinophagaceae bacterium]